MKISVITTISSLLAVSAAGLGHEEEKLEHSLRGAVEQKDRHHYRNLAGELSGDCTDVQIYCKEVDTDDVPIDLVFNQDERSNFEDAAVSAGLTILAGLGGGGVAIASLGILITGLLPSGEGNSSERADKIVNFVEAKLDQERIREQIEDTLQDLRDLIVDNQDAAHFATELENNRNSISTTEESRLIDDQLESYRDASQKCRTIFGSSRDLDFFSTSFDTQVPEAAVAYSFETCTNCMNSYLGIIELETREIILDDAKKDLAFLLGRCLVDVPSKIQQVVQTRVDLIQPVVEKSVAGGQFKYTGKDDVGTGLEYLHWGACFSQVFCTNIDPPLDSLVCPNGSPNRPLTNRVASQCEKLYSHQVATTKLQALSSRPSAGYQIYHNLLRDLQDNHGIVPNGKESLLVNLPDDEDFFRPPSIEFEFVLQHVQSGQLLRGLDDTEIIPLVAIPSTTSKDKYKFFIKGEHTVRFFEVLSCPGGDNEGSSLVSLRNLVVNVIGESEWQFRKVSHNGERDTIVLECTFTPTIGSPKPTTMMKFDPEADGDELSGSVVGYSFGPTTEPVDASNVFRILNFGGFPSTSA